MKNRQILAKIMQEIDSPDIIILTGPRQVGKTSLLKMVQEKLISEHAVNPDNIHWFDLEQVANLEIWQNQTLALSRLPLNSSERHYIFIDEFQMSPSIGSTLKVIHDHYPHLKCLATGSLSWWVTIDESMAGRKRVFNIWPLTFSEFVEWNKNEQIAKIFKTAYKESPITTSEIEEVNQEMLNYMAYGGYPAVVNAPDNTTKANILNELSNSFITRDILHFNRSADPVQTRKLLILLSSISGSLMDISRLSTDSGIGRTALLNRIGWLERMFIIRLFRPFFTNKTKELVKNPKIFLDDLGLRNELLQNFSVLQGTNEFGCIAKNFVANEITKCVDVFLHPLHFWRTKIGSEVDIIIKSGSNPLPIEIKGGNCNDIPNGLSSFIQTYKPKNAYILNWSVFKTEKHFNCTIHWRPLWWAEIITKNPV